MNKQKAEDWLERWAKQSLQAPGYPHPHGRALHDLHNFVHQHEALRRSSAMVARLSSTLWSMENVVALIDAATKPHGPYKAWAVKAA